MKTSVIFIIIKNLLKLYYIFLYDPHKSLSKMLVLSRQLCNDKAVLEEVHQWGHLGFKSVSTHSQAGVRIHWRKFQQKMSNYEPAVRKGPALNWPHVALISWIIRLILMTRISPLNVSSLAKSQIIIQHQVIMT